MIDFDYKIFLGAIAIGMTIWGHIPYLLETIKGINKPHIFTWVTWSLLTLIAFAAQFSGGGGAGAWVTGVTGLICIIITIFALRLGEKNITRSDWAMFIAGLAAIPLWLATDDPLSAVILVTAIDLCAFGPTFRKSWNKPFEENTFMYGFNVPRHALAIMALQEISLVTAIYPAALVAMNLVMYVMLKIRRKTLAID